MNANYRLTRSLHNMPGRLHALLAILLIALGIVTGLFAAGTAYAANITVTLNLHKDSESAETPRVK